MKIKISKSQWEMLKCAAIDDLSQDDMNFLSNLPKEIQHNVAKFINKTNPTKSQMRRLIDHLKQEQATLEKTINTVMDKTPAPSIDKIDAVIEQISSANPNDPAIDFLKQQKNEIEKINTMISEEDKTGLQNAKDNILDMFLEGKINKEQMTNRLQEFAKRNNSKKITLSKSQWEAIGRKTGWIKMPTCKQSN